jgi:transposase-like protein
MKPTKIAVCPRCHGIKIAPVQQGVDGSYKCADCGATFGLGDARP